MTISAMSLSYRDRFEPFNPNGDGFKGERTYAESSGVRLVRYGSEMIRIVIFDVWAIMAIMTTEKASVAHAKNTLSSLINKVAYGKTRVVLESRGRPKAALISTEDLEKLERFEAGEKTSDVHLH